MRKSISMNLEIHNLCKTQHFFKCEIDMTLREKSTADTFLIFLLLLRESMKFVYV